MSTVTSDRLPYLLRALKAPLMIPMHYFSLYTLQRFIDRTRGQSWEVEWASEPSIILSRASLPSTPKILVLPGR